VLCQHSTHDILVDFDAECISDLLGDAHATKPRIASLHSYDGGYKFAGRTFGTRFAAMRRRRKEHALFAVDQGPVEFEQCGRLDDCAKLRNSPRSHKQRRHREHEAIDRGQIRRTFSGTIADEELVLEQQGFGNDGTYPTAAGKPCQRDQQVNWVFRRIVTSRFGIVTDRFGNVTGDSGGT
jgi:hypothetical protein